MDVTEAPLGSILEGSKQYVIPLYQRPYSWQHKNWYKLWEDILELTALRKTNPRTSHFTGTLVLDLSTVTTGLTQFLVVDGQQRLTTLSVLLASIAKLWDDEGDPSSAKRVREQYLVNVYASGVDVRYRLRPANFDEPVFRMAVDGHNPSSDASKIDDAFAYFTHQLKKLDERGLSLEQVEEAVLFGLKFVTITAKSEDNVYRIFESINNTGIDLTQADLVRNFLFMRLGTKGEQVHSEVWLPLVSKLSPDDVELVFWIDELWRDPDARKLDVYDRQKRHIASLGDEDLQLYLKRIGRIADVLRLIRGASQVADEKLQSRIDRFSKLDIPGAVSAAAKVLFLYFEGKVNASEAEAAMGILESYLVRRAVVAAPVSSLGRIAARSAHNLEGDIAAELHKRLSTGRLRYVTDAEIRRTILESPMYARGRRDHLKFILQTLIEADQGKDKLDFTKTSIEHILPQNLSGEAKDEFLLTLEDGAEFEDVHDSLVHTLGNLTLTNHNSELSNDSFSKKRARIQEESGIRANLRIAEEVQWGPREILQRGEHLAARVIGTWVGPDESLLGQKGASIADEIASVVALVGPGHWTTYGEIAKVVGTASQAVGNALSRQDAPEGSWRVLRAGGRVAKYFQWPAGSPYRDRSCQEVLESEGLSFVGGVASPNQKISTETLLARLGELAEV